MNKENILFGVVGLLLGLIIGFIATNNINQTGATPMAAATAMQANSNMPAGHPDIGSTGKPKEMTPEGQAAIDAAKQSPNDIDAQLKAAEVYYMLDRFDEAIVLLKAANKLEPDNREVLVHLGNANFDGEHWDEAEKWYLAALAKKNDDVNARTDLGLIFVFRDPPNYDRAIAEFNRSLAIDPNHIQTLQNLTVAYSKKGNTAKAKETLAKLESVDPKNAALNRLRDDIGKMGNGS
ncbi:MAG TPA: tetratricopeptide repeat protein [Pyrinomonadaceae bacterium]|nr:tetratricopeptide repeat protein [Pyrinomonadaceae bacterium]